MENKSFDQDRSEVTNNRESGYEGIGDEVPFTGDAQDIDTDDISQTSQEARLASEAERLRGEISAIYDRTDKAKQPEEIFDIGSMDVRNQAPSSPFEATAKLRGQLGQLEAQQRQLSEEAAAMAEQAHNDTLVAEALQEGALLAAEEQAKFAQEQRIGEENRRALMTPYEEAKEKTYAFLEKHPLTRTDAEKAGRHEYHQIKRLLSRVERNHDSAQSKKESFLSRLVDKRNYEKDMEELRRYGYPDSPDFKRLSKANTNLDLSDLGEKRYKDFQLVKNLESAIDKKQLKKAHAKLKKDGFKSLPERWDDDNFTSHEILTIRQTLEFYARGEED